MQRIRNSFRYGLVLAVNVALMVLFHSYLNFLFIIGMIVFSLYSLCGLYFVKESISLDIAGPVEAMKKGEEFMVHFRLRNSTWFPFMNTTLKIEVSNPFYQEVEMHELNVPLRAKKTTEISYPIVMESCGRLVICVKSVEVVGWFGIWNIKKNLSTEWECLIYPISQPQKESVLSIYNKGMQESVESVNKGSDFSEVSGIREYIPGDKLQNIHWKLSVKREELMVKERTSVSALQLTIFVEIWDDTQMGLEAILELADSITHSLVMQNLPFVICYYSTKQNDIVRTNISSETERVEWLGQLLYDTAYTDQMLARELFLSGIEKNETYLYIGYCEGMQKEMMHREQKVGAWLEENTD